MELNNKKIENSVQLEDLGLGLNEFQIPVKQELEIAKISNLTEDTTFSKAVDFAKTDIVKDATINDDKFVKDVTKELKDAFLKSAQLENEKQELEKKNIELNQAYIQTQQELEEQKQSVNKWENKQKSREYHFNGLKDIMAFVHINNPMCIPLMYIFAVLVSPIYLIWTLILCPLGTFIAGTKDADRPRVVKGAIYTIMCIALIVFIGFLMYACMHYWFGWF